MAIISLVGCSENDEIIDTSQEEEYVYSFTAVLGETQSRVSYHEDSISHNLKMVWDEGDEIRLYPDASMNDTTKYYSFVANTGKGTQRTVFVHQGYIPNWENWSGRAIYVFPNGDNLDVENNSKDFEKKFHTQISNDNTEHIKYAEHVLEENGDRKDRNYLEYWSDHLENYNLKHDHEMFFDHPHTVVYKIMLRGFIYNIPGGSLLKVSGATWPDGEISLTLGSIGDEEPFLKVGEFGRDGYNEDAVLTAYIIRQVVGDTDGSIKKNGKLKFELYSYDKEDGREYPLVEEDQMTHRTSKVDANRFGYFVNLPWGDEYTWEATASADIDYKTGDYVVADLTDLSTSKNYPRIAIDLGLPRKWAAYNVGAKKTDDYGKLFAFGYTNPHNLFHDDVTSEFPNNNIELWPQGDDTYDAATALWGQEWITPTEKEMFDIFYYCRMIDSSGNKMPLAPFDKDNAARTQYQWKDHKQISDTYLWLSTEDCYLNYNDVLLARFISTHNGRYFYWPISGSIQSNQSGNDPGTRGYYLTNSWYLNRGPFLFFILYSTSKILGYNPIAESYRKAYSVRPVKRHLTD